MDWINLIIVGSASLTSVSLVGGFVINTYKRFHKIKSWRDEETTKLQGIALDSTIELINSPLFITPMGQKEPPHDSDWVEGAERRIPLIENIIKDIVTNKKSINKRHYFILGGSGMGKSTFSVALFYKYINKYRFKKSPYSIYILSLGDPDIFSEIQKIPTQERAKSIIILDALDENAEAANDIDTFMGTMNEVIRKFKFVIITCRTQLFSEESKEPSTSKYKSNGYNKNFVSYDKYYISPFTKEETYSYLEYKYPLISKNYQKAIILVDKCDDLMARPMILAFIDDLLKLPNTDKLTSVELYGTIINSWFERECEVQMDMSVPELFSFSKALALYMYDKWLHKSESHLTEEEFQYFYTQSGYKSSPYSFKVRSLINRTSTGLIKFSHRNFWEFFLALCSMEYPGISFKSIGFEKAKQFSEELCKMYLEENNLISIPYIYNYRPFALSQTDINNTSEIIDEAIQSIKRSNSKRNKEKTYSLVYDIWEVILQCWISMPRILSLGNGQIEVITDIKIEIEKQIKVIESGYPTFFAIGEFEKLLYQFQGQMDNVNTVLTLLSDIQLKINEIRQLIHNTNTLLLQLVDPKKMYYVSYQKETVIFPYLFDYSKSEEYIRKITIDSDTLPVLGYGFNDAKDMDKLILNNTEKVIKTVNYSGLICIVRGCKDIDDLVSFIELLIQQNYDNDFVIIANINQVSIKYLIADDSKTDDKRTIEKNITTMIKAKSN